MKKYTKQQLVKAMTKYNENFKNDPDQFAEIETDSKETAERQIEYLLEIADEQDS